MRRPGRAWPAPGIVLLLLVVAAGCRPGGGAVRDTAGPPPTTALVPPVTPTTAPPPVAPAVNIVAAANHPTLQIFAGPGNVNPVRTMANPTESGAPLVFLVEKQQPGWIQVHLPVRPNGSLGWVRAGDVDLTQNDYRIEVELATFTIRVWKGPAVILTDRVGIGAGATPTPGGRYYIKELLRPPNPNGPYGAYAYGLSGFSEVLTSFSGGPGTLGIHGTNDPTSVGHAVSYGCIRMSNASITALAQILPLGVPVDILA